MSTRFPSLFPKLWDPLWFDVDKPLEDESQLAEEEKEHQNWLKSIEEKNKDVIPIGKTTAEVRPYGEYDEEEEEDEDEIESEEESDEPDDLEVTDYDQDSPDDVEMDMNNDAEASNSPAWMI